MFILGVTKMKLTFQQCGKFNADVTGWDTSKVVTFERPFCWCGNAFQGKGMGGWDLSAATNTYGLIWWIPNMRDDISGW